MSEKSRWLGPLFGIGCLIGSAGACSGDPFSGGSSNLAGSPNDGGSGADDTTTTPKGGGQTSGGTVDVGEGGMGPEPTVIPNGGTATGGTSHGGSAGAGASAGTAGGGAGGSGGSGGSGGGVIDPPDGTAGEPNVVDPPVDLTCKDSIAEAWTAPLSADGTWVKVFGDPFVDTQQHRLVVSYDDIVDPTHAFKGSYYFESDVTFEGGTAFTIYPSATYSLLPSLRRDATGSGIELGATKYGSGNAWSVSGWGALSGKVVAGTSKVRLGTYVQATSKKLALKVSSGGKAYRSAWLTDFALPETNLGIMRYVGENNSIVFSGPSSYIYVDPVSGCQGLTDAAVVSLFED